jgi:hypothetical protein
MDAIVGQVMGVPRFFKTKRNAQDDMRDRKSIRVQVQCIGLRQHHSDKEEIRG